MELKQTKTIIDVRRGYLMTVLGVSVIAILVAAVIANNVSTYSIPVFTVFVFAVFVIMLSLFYDVFINSTYRIFLVDDDVYLSLIHI